ncbi:MAG: hypothetical protein WAZ21_01950 [Candidatus Saccharimonadales bacterium]|jgi:hypothetical protein
MQSSTRTNQGGSILIFTIVAVVLALALVGSVLFVRNKGEIAQTQVPIFGPVTAPTEAPDDRNGTTNNGTTPAPADNNATEGSDKRGSPAPTSNNNKTTAPAAELPKTGPADTAISVVVIALVTMTAVSYVRSRHLSWQL